MHCRRMSDQAFLLGVAVEAGDRAQPPRDGRSRPPTGLQLSTEALDVNPARLEEATPMVRAPERELPQIQRVRLPGEPR